MKVRNGFVSNSSTSSFYIYGIEVDGTEVKNAIIKKDGMAKIKKEMEEYLETDLNEDQVLEYLEEEIGEWTNLLNLDLCVHEDWDNGLMYFGASPRDIDDDETGAEFKQRIKDILKKVFPNAECNWMSGSYPS